jgi:hypothetical protein
MNTPYTAGTARPASYGAGTYFFTQDSQSLTNSPIRALSNTGRFTSEAPVMHYRKANSRARYASALYAAALAAMLSACAKTDVAVETAPAAAPIHLSESENIANTADMPEVVISASRERPRVIG